MYSVDDFFRIFNFLKNNPDLTNYSANVETEENIKLYKELLLLQRQLDICVTFKHIYDNGIYPFEYALQQVKTSSHKIYTYITQDGESPTEVIPRNEEYIDYLNQRIDQLEIVIFKLDIVNGNIDYFDIHVKALAIECRNESIQFFENIIDQIAFNTNDFIKLRRFIIDWYSSLKTFLKLQRFSADAFALTDKLLDTAIESFGFDHPDIFDSKSVKAALLLSLVNIYKKKGSPYSILEFLKFLNIKEAAIYEWWLHRYRYTGPGEGIDGDLYLKAIKLGKFQKYEQDMHDFDRKLSWHEFSKELDCHWDYDENEIKAIDDSLEYLSLPSILPYFSIAVFFNQAEVSSTISFLNSIFNILFIKHIQYGIKEDRIITVNEFETNMNILEIYLGLLYSYNRYNDYVKYMELRNFITTEYRIEPESYDPKPFVGEWPHQYEKLYHWMITTEDYNGNLMTLKDFKLYPFSTELYPNEQDINQNDNLDINYDNALGTEYDFCRFIPYVLVHNKSNQEKLLSYRNIYENIYDIYDYNDYDKIKKEELYPLLEKIESYKDIYYIYNSYNELMNNVNNLPLDTVCVVKKDETLDFYHKYNPSLYKVTSPSTVEKIENEDKYDYFKHVEDKSNYEQYKKEWSLSLTENFSKNLKDPERLLTGEMPETVDHKYDLPITDNEIDDYILVKHDEERKYLPSLYKCINTSGDINDQWAYVTNGLSIINYGIFPELIQKIDDFTLGDPEQYYQATLIFAEYINIFTNTFIGDNNYNVKELLLSQAKKIEEVLEAVKPFRARLFSYESISHIDDSSVDNVIPIDVFDYEVIQTLPFYPLREPIRNDIDKNFDYSEYLYFDRPHVYDHLEILDNNVYPCLLFNEDETIYLDNEPVFETDLPIIGIHCGEDPQWQTTFVYENTDQVIEDTEEVIEDVLI